MNVQVGSSRLEKAHFLSLVKKGELQLYVNIESLYDYFRRTKSLFEIVSYILATNFLFVRYYTFKNLVGYSVESLYTSKYSYRANSVCLVKNYKYKNVDFNFYYVADYTEDDDLCDIKNVNEKYKKKNIEIMRIVSFLYNRNTQCVFCNDDLVDCDIVYTRRGSTTYDIQSFIRDVYNVIKSKQDFRCYNIVYDNDVKCYDKNTLVFTDNYSLSCEDCSYHVVFNSYLVKDVNSLSRSDVITSKFFNVCSDKNTIILPARSITTDFSKNAIYLSLIKDGKQISII